jgi:Ecdysteroid kinase-like family
MSQTGFHGFLNEEFFAKVIRHYTKDDEARVKEFAIQSGSKAGESFASDLLRASINYATVESEAESISVIVKVIPEGGGDIDGKRLFMTEMKMYGDTLIDINRLLLSTGDTIKLFPR